MSSIQHYKYTYSIQSNGSIIFSFDYFPYGFKINEIHYLNFFLEYENFFSKTFSFYYFNNIDFSYFYIYYKKIFLINNNLLIKNVNQENFFFFYNNTLFDKKKLNVFDNVIAYSNIHIIKILLFFKKKIFFNIFYNL